MCPRDWCARSSGLGNSHCRCADGGWQPGSPLLPGCDHPGGAGGDRQPAAHPAGLVVVVDQVVLPVDDLDAAGAQANHFAGTPPGVAQDPVDRLVHQLQVGGGDCPGPSGRAEQVQAGVELADHCLGQGLAYLVLIRVVADPVPAGGPERAGHRGHQPAGAAVLDHLAELVDHQVAVRRRVQAAAGAPLHADRVEDAGEITGAEARRVGAAGRDQDVGGGLAGAQRLPQPLQVGPGAPRPVPGDLPQPRRFDHAEVDHALGGRPAPGGVDLQVEQRHLPHIAGERVRAGVLGPGPVQVPAQVTEQPPGRRVVLHPTGLADHLRVGLAQRPRAAEAGEQDPHLGGIQRRRRLIALLQRVDQLGLQQLRQPGKGELVHPEPGPLAGDPGRQLLIGQRGDRALAAQPLVMEAAQPAAGDALPVAAGDPAPGGPGQRPGPGDEHRDRFAPVLAPAAFMPETQAGTVQIAFTTGHRAAVPAQRPGGTRRRRGVELRPGHVRAHPGAAAAVAAPRRAARRRRAPRRAARPRRGPWRLQIAGEQQRLAVPLARAPGRIQPGAQPLRPPVLTWLFLAGAGGPGRPRRAPAHRYRLPAATASTARRLSSSRACR